MPEAAPINPTPRARFQSSSDNISKHRNLIGTHEFQRAIDLALLQYALDLSKTEASLASATHWRLLGAQEFIFTLRNLAEMPQHVTTAPPPNLIHKA